MHVDESTKYALGLDNLRPTASAFPDWCPRKTDKSLFTLTFSLLQLREKPYVRSHTVHSQCRLLPWLSYPETSVPDWFGTGIVTDVLSWTISRPPANTG